jgi:hypothetical protein
VTEGPVQGGPQVAPVSSQTVIRTTQDTHSYSRNVQDVHQQFGQLEPERISDACRAWKRAGGGVAGAGGGVEGAGGGPVARGLVVTGVPGGAAAVAGGSGSCRWQRRPPGRWPTTACR